MLAIAIRFITILSITFIAANASNTSVCVDKGVFADIRGPFKHLLFDETLNGDIYYYPRPHTTVVTQYLYPFKTNTDYLYLIGATLYSDVVHHHCMIGNIGVLGENYRFNINHCQYWAFFNGTKNAWELAADMIVTECQFDDVCVEKNLYLPYLNADYKYMHWNYTINGAYYYNQVIKKWIYPYFIPSGNKTSAHYIIDSVVGDNAGNAFCEIGVGVEQWYIFSFDDCQIFKAYYQLSWQIEPDMTISTNCINQITSMPTTSPTGITTQVTSKSPTVNPSKSPTINPSNIPTVNPSNIPTVNPSKSPTINPSNIPTVNPSNIPTVPTVNPSNIHTVNPSNSRSSDPSQSSSKVPTTSPQTWNPTSSPSNNATNNIEKKPILIGSQLYIWWYFVAATVLFVVLTILIVTIVCLYKKNTKLTKKTSNIQLPRQRLQSDASSLNNTAINNYALVQQLPALAEGESTDGMYQYQEQEQQREGEYGNAESQLVESPYL